MMLVMFPGQGGHITAEETAGENRLGSCAVIALAWMTGLLIGSYTGAPGGAWLRWCAGGAVAMVLLMVLTRRSVRAWAILATVIVAGCWIDVHEHFVQRDHIVQYVRDESVIVQVTGTIDGEARTTPEQRGAFAEKFSWTDPLTVFVLELDSVVIDGATKSASGRLLCRIKEPEHRIHAGMRIAAKGWLSKFEAPDNPGQFDFRKLMKDRGIAARLTLSNRRNWSVLEESSGPGMVASWREAISLKAAESLRLGMEPQTQRLAFLDAVLLGRRDPDARELTENFRRVGLAHLLAISGAHLAILLGMVWVMARVVTPTPRSAAVVVLVVLSLYLIAVPMRVPIVRAGLMMALFCGSHATGRRFRSIDLLSLAALLVLIWQPNDLFNAGFQLSFGCVAGLLLFTGGVSRWLWKGPMIVGAVSEIQRLKLHIRRRLVDYLAVNLVAFSVSMPLVAYHYQLVCPFTVLMALLSLPVITITLGLGFLKVCLGLLLPSLGMLMATPVEWIADVMLGLVGSGVEWPGAWYELPRPPSLLWVTAATCVVLALLSGWFDRRKLALGGAFVVCAAWLVLPLHPSTAGWFREEVAKGELRMSMLSVGDGSCYVLRVPEANGERVVMFDCGSKRLMDVGSRIVIPALRYMGVERIDTIILSHADLDHFCGVLDLQKGIPIDRILAPAHLLEDAVSRPRSAAAFLVNELKAQGLVVTSISRGWKEAWGDVRAEVLWPPVECDLKSKNDTSIVMRIETGGRRILMNGDIANQAIGELLESNEDLRADVVELPHHGSFVSRSLSWLKAVSPSVALQSCGRVRMIGDRWGEPLTELGAEHLVSSRAGQTEISITSDGRMRWRAFVGKRWNQVEPDVRPEMAISSSSP